MTLPQSPLPAYADVPLNRPLYGATFTQAIKRFFTKYATFSGRASRAEYWWIVLFGFLVGLVIAIPGGIIGNLTQTAADQANGQPGIGFLPFGILGIVFGLATIVPSIALAVRRLHDANFSGLFYLLTFIPYVGGLIVLIMNLMGPRPEGARFDV
jgi:uncharacterized membrane protein YhaH (DUF805 family)